MMESKELVVVEQSQMGLLEAKTPAGLVKSASDMATALKDVIVKRQLFSKIQGKEYVHVEGWTTLAAMCGLIPQEVSNEQTDDGRYIATVELVRIKDGQVVSRASAECGGAGEKNFKPGAAPQYAIRSMAATRATSKACRLALSWIMVMAGFKPTPAEEMDSVEVEAAPSGPDDVVDFGKYKGKKWSELPDAYIAWAIKNWDGERLARAEQEQAQRVNADVDVPPPDDNDGLPF